MMTEEGIASVVSDLNANVGVTHIMSNLTQKQTLRLLNRYGNVLNKWFFYNRVRYNVSVADRDKIFEMIFGNVEKALSRARDGFQAKLIAKSWGSKEIIEKSEKAENFEENKPMTGFSIFRRRG